MSNKYLWNTDELINEEDLEFPDRDKERSRRRYKKGLTIAKRRKEVADRNGIKVRGGLHRFVDSKIGDILQPNNQRKRSAYMKKHTPSLDEERLENATIDAFDDMDEEDTPMYEYNEDFELLY